MGRNKEITSSEGATRSFYRKRIHEMSRRPLLNKKEERSLRRQQLGEAASDEVTLIVDQPITLRQPLLHEEEENIATVRDWEWRMVHQEIRLAQVTSEAHRRNTPIPAEWAVYKARLEQNGTPVPPEGLAAE